MDLIGCIGVDDCLSSPYLTSIKIIARILWRNNDSPENFGFISRGASNRPAAQYVQRYYFMDFLKKLNCYNSFNRIIAL